MPWQPGRAAETMHESQMDWVWAWDTQCWCPVSCLILYPWAVPTLTGWPPVCSDSGLTNVNRTVSRWCSGLLWPFLQWEGVTASVHQVIRVKAGAANPGVLGAQLPPGWRLSPWKMPDHRHDSQCQDPVTQREEDNRVLPDPGPDTWVGPEAINHIAFPTALLQVLVSKLPLGLALLRWEHTS